jgi:hypothetical protein
MSSPDGKLIIEPSVKENEDSLFKNDGIVWMGGKGPKEGLFKIESSSSYRDVHLIRIAEALERIANILEISKGEIK